MRQTETTEVEQVHTDIAKRLLRELFTVCENTEDECSESDDPFKRGRLFEAKRIRKGIGTWYQDNF